MVLLQWLALEAMAGTTNAQAASVMSGPIERGCPSSAVWGQGPAIRSPDARLRALLLGGCRMSPTLRQLAGAIGRTDGIVYLAIGPCPLRALRGCLLHSVHDTGNARYMWIRLSANTDERELIATIAHELQHALEVLIRADLRSQHDLLDFYRSMASRAYSATTLGSPFRTYETDEAITIAAAVRQEVAGFSEAAYTDERE